MVDKSVALLCSPPVDDGDVKIHIKSSNTTEQRSR